MSTTGFSLDFTITPSVAAHKAGGKSTIRRSARVEGKLDTNVRGKLEVGSAADLARIGIKESVLEHLQHSVRYTLASMDRMSQKSVLDTEADKEIFHKLLERVGSTIKAIYTNNTLISTTFSISQDDGKEMPTEDIPLRVESLADGNVIFCFTLTSDGTDGSSLKPLQENLRKVGLRDEDDERLQYIETEKAYEQRVGSNLKSPEQFGQMITHFNEQSILENTSDLQHSEQTTNLAREVGKFLARLS